VAWVLDLDGVVWLGGRAIPGAPEAIARLRDRGTRVVLATNNALFTIREYLEKLEVAGVQAGPEDLVTSAQVAAQLVSPGERVLSCAGPGAEEALMTRGALLVGAPPVDAVVVGLRRDFDYDLLAAAADAARAGARLLATNDDATYPVAGGLLPGAGALLAAVVKASGAGPVVAGKPYAPMAEHLLARYGRPEVVVGDRPATDGVLARHLGARFALVLSGVTTKAQAALADPAPDEVADTLADLVSRQG